MTNQTQVKHTPTPWIFREYMGDENHNLELVKHNIEPTLNIGNSGERYISAENVGVAVIHCHTPYKRGQGNKHICPIAKANAQFIVKATNNFYSLRNSVQDALKFLKEKGFEDTNIYRCLAINLERAEE